MKEEQRGAFERVLLHSADLLTFMTQFKTPWVALSNCPDVWV